MLSGDLEGFIDDEETGKIGTEFGNVPGGDGVPEIDDLEEEFDDGFVAQLCPFPWVLGERTNGANDGATVDWDIVAHLRDYQLRGSKVSKE